MDKFSYIGNADVGAIDDLYQQYIQDNDSVDFGWRKFFEGFELGQQRFNGNTAEINVSDDIRKEINVLNLIKGYRTRGHLFTKTNPVRERRQYSPTLDLVNFDLSPSDLDKVFNAGIEIGIGPAKLKDIIAHLQKTYCESIGAEYVYIRDPKKVDWLQQRMEQSQNIPRFNLEDKQQILRKLNQATVFENFIHTKYVGQKRFSLEGLESLIPALDAVIEYGAELGVAEFVLGMAHRGRLNVLANIMNKTYEEIFKEFEGNAYIEDGLFEGDVKYHLGFSSDVTTRKGKAVRLNLAANPSHLETVNPVVKGMARAKIKNHFQYDIDKVCPILIHGDASISGQGIIYEVLQMAGHKAYNVGGCMHIVTNNQIGFTTNYTDSRTSTYCTDIAKVTLCPVFHVNGDDAEAVVFAIRMAMEYRQEFNSDVFIDLLGYRKYGHNEGDEPRFTQPMLYKIIATHKNPREIYTEKLLSAGSVEADLAKSMEKDFRALLQEKLESAKSTEPSISVSGVKSIWDGIRTAMEKDFYHSPNTSIERNKFETLAKSITTIPDDFIAFGKVQKLFADRRKMIETGSYDWAMGEWMAYATLLDEGHDVRMSGQDVERGTFSHRHAILKQEDSEREYSPLQHIHEQQSSTFEIYNSILSEYAVLGFEFGYSWSSPNALTIWEAQFGDFSNGAQIIIDQYISSAEVKWKRHSGLVLLLPHGHEGQGPEHSSARLERYLQLSAKANWQVINCTTPANMFHALRRQLHRNIRVPLIAMTPKSLLRHPACVSTIDEFTSGGFRELIDDTYVDAQKVTRVLFCSGKVYYDLLEKQRKDERKDVAIVRLEQLYPCPDHFMKPIYEKYKHAEFCWVQEEPKNMGAWSFLLRWDINFKLRLISRKSSATPATGFSKIHTREQNQLVKEAFA